MKISAMSIIVCAVALTSCDNAHLLPPPPPPGLNLKEFNPDKMEQLNKERGVLRNTSGIRLECHSVVSQKHTMDGSPHTRGVLVVGIAEQKNTNHGICQPTI